MESIALKPNRRRPKLPLRYGEEGSFFGVPTSSRTNSGRGRRIEEGRGGEDCTDIGGVPEGGGRRRSPPAEAEAEAEMDGRWRWAEDGDIVGI